MKKLSPEEKELIFKDLCSRVPYNPTVKVKGEKEPKQLEKRIRWMITFGRAKSLEDCLEGLTVYLRPMSSMTEEEKSEFDKIRDSVEARFINAVGKGGYTLAFTDLDDWLLAHHFDFRGLIPRDLALKAENGMYKI